MAAAKPTPIAIAGASGFVGRALLAKLARTHPVIALSRRPMNDVPKSPDAPFGITWRQANLFNLKHIEEALVGSEVAIYLVHSMLPPARLSQGHFADLDLICADNFARAAKRVGVRRIIYLGGLIPDERPLSPHLASRLEIEEALGDHGLPVTTLRAGIVLGPGGSSFTMMMRLVERLPLMLLPQWTRSKCQPIGIRQVVNIIGGLIDDDALPPGAYDIGGKEVLRYQAMLTQLAALTRRRRLLLAIPLWTPRVSLMWVRLITGVPLELIGPLVQSLRHDMLVRQPLPPQYRHEELDGAASFIALAREALGQAPEAQLAPQGHEPKASSPVRATKAMPRRTQQAQRARGVISVQRLFLPSGRDAAWVASEYGRFLPSGLGKIGQLLIRVDEAGEATKPGYTVTFRVARIGLRLLQLSYAPERSSPGRQLFYISDGTLVRATPAQEPGRFEFRSVLGNRHVLAAVHDFVPRLPWFLYRWTQALVHAAVMRRYGFHLAHSGPDTDPPRNAGRKDTTVRL